MEDGSLHASRASELSRAARSRTKLALAPEQHLLASSGQPYFENAKRMWLVGAAGPGAGHALHHEPMHCLRGLQNGVSRRSVLQPRLTRGMEPRASEPTTALFLLSLPCQSPRDERVVPATAYEKTNLKKTEFGRMHEVRVVSEATDQRLTGLSSVPK